MSTVDIRTHDVAKHDQSITVASGWGVLKRAVYRTLIIVDETTAIGERASIVAGERSRVWANFSIEEHQRTTEAKLAEVMAQLDKPD